MFGQFVVFIAPFASFIARMVCVYYDVPARASLFAVYSYIRFTFFVCIWWRVSAIPTLARARTHRCCAAHTWGSRCARYKNNNARARALCRVCHSRHEALCAATTTTAAAAVANAIYGKWILSIIIHPLASRTKRWGDVRPSERNNKYMIITWHCIRVYYMNVCPTWKKRKECVLDF